MSEKNSRTSSFGRLVMVFSGIMFLFLMLTAGQTAEKLQREHHRSGMQALETSLDQVIMQTADDAYVFNRFRQLIEVARKNGCQSQELQNAIGQCENFYLTPVKAFFYQNRNLVKAYAASTDELELFRPILAGMALAGKEFDKAQRQLHQQLLSAFGPGNRLELVRLTKGQLKRYKSGKADQFYYWNEFDDGLGVFFIATGFPGFIDRFRIISPDNTRFGAGNPAGKKWLAPHGLTADQVAAARIKAGLSGENSTIAFGHHWFFVDDESGVFWCRVINEKDFATARPQWAENIHLLAAALLISSILFYLTAFADITPGSRLCQWLDSLSIRYRIMGLFAMASVFPVIFTILIGATSLADREEIIENSIVSESISAIEPLEKMYLEKLANVEALARDIRQALISRPPSEQFFNEMLQNYNVPRDLSRLEVRDGSGNTLFSTDDREVHGVAEAMDIFSRIALKLHAPARMGQAVTRISPAEIVSESVLSTDEIGMATIMRQRGRQWMFRMGTFPTTWFWDAYPEIASGPAFMCFTTQVLITYGLQVLEKMQNQSPESDRIQLATDMNYDFCSFAIQPKIKNLDSETLLAAAMASYRTGRLIFRETTINGRQYWVTVKPEKNINTHVFFHLISQTERLQVLNPLKWQLATGSILALLISLLGATLIARLVIVPITDLGNGINAIRERNIEFRTPVRRNDEFGSLAIAFNNVIGELKELEYGRIVQESLLPAAPIIPNGYDLAFFNTSATDLAGDYHDVVELDDGRLVLILGDVTGHGISAALAMAMAKATVNYMGRAGRLFPITLMDSLNALFNKELKPRHKFMTLITVVLDPATGTIEMDNAGQSYPRLFLAETSSSVEIAMPSMPLGAMKKRKTRVETRQMRSGDAMILYTDGIIECAEPGGEMYGYERFHEHFDQLMRNRVPAKEALKQLISGLDSFRQPGPYPDDVTLVLLIKK